MRSRKWKLFAFILAGIMTTVSLSGCGQNGTGSDSGQESSVDESSDENSTNNESSSADSDAPAETSQEAPYEATVMYFVGNEAATGIQAVEDRFNELTMAELNIKVDLMPITYGTYRQQIQLILSGGEALDIMPMWPENAGTFIEAQYVLDLTDYLEYAPEVLSMIGMDDIKCCSMGDFIWGIPVMMERSHPNAFIMRNDILQEIGVSVDDIQSLDDLTEVFAKVQERYPDMVIYGGQYNMAMPYATMEIDTLGDRFGVLDQYGQTAEVVNYYETETFYQLCDYMRDWYQKGYVSKDFATSTDIGEKLMKAGNLFSYTTNTKPNSKAEKDEQTGYDTAIYQYNDHLLTTWGTSTVGYAIANSSEDPVKAMQLYNWIIATEEANDLLNWGVEGVDWVEAADGTATFPEGIDSNNAAYHQNDGWRQPNQQNAHVWTGTDPDVFASYQEAKDQAIVSVAYGFAFDSSNVVDELAALAVVRDQYVYTISSGSVEPEEAIREMNQAYYDAGLQKVIDEKQAQLDAWLAANP